MSYYPRYSSSYRISREPAGTTYYTSSYVTPTYFSPVSEKSHLLLTGEREPDNMFSYMSSVSHTRTTVTERVGRKKE